jgi:hypothetical protein
MGLGMLFPEVSGPGSGDTPAATPLVWLTVVIRGRHTGLRQQARFSVSLPIIAELWPYLGVKVVVPFDHFPFIRRMVNCPFLSH